MLPISYVVDLSEAIFGSDPNGSPPPKIKHGNYTGPTRSVSFLHSLPHTVADPILIYQDDHRRSFENSLIYIAIVPIIIVCVYLLLDILIRAVRICRRGQLCCGICCPGRAEQYEYATPQDYEDAIKWRKRGIDPLAKGVAVPDLPADYNNAPGDAIVVDEFGNHIMAGRRQKTKWTRQIRGRTVDLCFLLALLLFFLIFIFIIVCFVSAAKVKKNLDYVQYTLHDSQDYQLLLTRDGFQVQNLMIRAQDQIAALTAPITSSSIMPQEIKDIANTINEFIAIAVLKSIEYLQSGIVNTRYPSDGAHYTKQLSSIFQILIFIALSIMIIAMIILICSKCCCPYKGGIMNASQIFAAIAVGYTWCVAMIILAGLVGLSDPCMKPNEYIIGYALTHTDTQMQQIVGYYVTCPLTHDSSLEATAMALAQVNPLASIILTGGLAINATLPLLIEIDNVVSSLGDNQITRNVNALTQTAAESNRLTEQVIRDLNCARLHDNYVAGANALCHDGLAAALLVVIFLGIASLLFLFARCLIRTQYRRVTPFLNDSDAIPMTVIQKDDIHLAVTQPNTRENTPQMPLRYIDGTSQMPSRYIDGTPQMPSRYIDGMPQKESHNNITPQLDYRYIQDSRYVEPMVIPVDPNQHSPSPTMSSPDSMIAHNRIDHDFTVQPAMSRRLSISGHYRYQRPGETIQHDISRPQETIIQHDISHPQSVDYPVAPSAPVQPQPPPIPPKPIATFVHPLDPLPPKTDPLPPTYNSQYLPPQPYAPQQRSPGYPMSYYHDEGY